MAPGPKVRVGDIKKVSGEVTIAGGNVHKGFTAQQVSALLTQITSTFQVKKFDGRCPYKGLDVFEEEDAELFFGRERVVDELVERVKASRTVFITGPSGSGKSSLIRAGLIPALKRGATKNSERWLYETIKPGRDPLEALASAFSRLKSPELGRYFRENFNQPEVLHECAESALSGRKDQRLVLFIDQFEELFTQVGRDKAEPFLNILTRAASIENGRVNILFAMRSDFVSNCAAYLELNQLLNQQFVQIGVMQPDELVSAIAQPALRVGLRIDPDLIAQIIRDMQGEPGALPLMQFALKDLFDMQEKKGGAIALTLTDYLQQGGIHKALERHADNAFSMFSKDEQELARIVFSGLIEIGRGTQDTSRTALFNELVPADRKAGEVSSVVQKLADARLITTYEQSGVDTVTISHEKLIDAWPWLRKLISENRDAIALQNEIANDAKEWEEHKRDPSYLYTGARLIHAREQMGAKKLSLSGLAHEFVEASQARRRYGQYAVVAGASVVIFSLLFATILFRNQAEVANSARATAETNLRISRSQELAAQALFYSNTHPDFSFLLGVESLNTYDTPSSRNNLLINLQSNSKVFRYLPNYSGSVTSIAFRRNDKILATAGFGGKIILWDVSEPEKSVQISKPFGSSISPVNCVKFSPNGMLLASASSDKNIYLWNISDLSAPVQLGKLAGHEGPVYSIAFDDNGKILASGSDDQTIRIWNISNPSRPLQVGHPITEHQKAVNTVAFERDRHILISGSDDDDKTIIIWDVSNPSNPIKLSTISEPGGITNVAISPNNKTLASGGWNSRVGLWDISNPSAPQQLASPLSGHQGSVFSVAFSQDGRILASGGADDKILLWDVSDPNAASRTEILAAHGESVNSLAFDPADLLLVSGDQAGITTLWNIGKFTYHPISLKQFNLPNYDVLGDQKYDFNLDTKIMASVNSGGTVIIQNISDFSAPIQMGRVVDQNPIHLIVLSGDAKTLASIDNLGQISLWDIEHPSDPKSIPLTRPIKGYPVLFSPDKNILATVTDDSRYILWDISNINTPKQLSQPIDGWPSAFSPNGKTLASVISDSDGDRIILWDISSPSLPAQLDEPILGGMRVAFSPDGKTLATDQAGIIYLWDISNPAHRIPGASLSGHKNPITNLSFSPDGKILVSDSFGEIILWDVTNASTPIQIGQPFFNRNTVTRFFFSPDSQVLVSLGYGGEIGVWDINPYSWANLACNKAGRNLTPTEWTQFMSNEPYRATCPQWPLEPTATPTP